jgi:hypothetical protein
MYNESRNVSSHLKIYNSHLVSVSLACITDELIFSLMSAILSDLGLSRGLSVSWH